MKKKVLIYDSSCSYLNFLKKKLANELTVIDYNKLNESELTDFENFDALLFILNDEKELVDLMWLNTMVPHLFLSTKFKKFISRMNTIDKVTVLDLNKTKNEILNTFLFQLNSIEGYSNKNNNLRAV